MSGDAQVRFCERPGVRFPGPTRLADTVNGANAAAVFYTMVETAKGHNLHPEHYLNYVFTHLPTADTLEKQEALLPWNVTPEQITPALAA